MIARQSTVQAQLKTTQQLVVRFAHAPRVKLTLRSRGGALASPEIVRVLTLRDARPTPRIGFQ